MPLTKRSVSPVRISLHRLPPNVRENELECVANGTLANLVRQLSSLSRHAEDIFGELFREAVKVEHKTSILFNRIDRIALKVTQLDSNVEEVSLQDLHLRKPFKSSTLIDQQSLSRQTMPAAMTECYGQCDRPPDLDKLNPYRTDNKAALKFYTDPDYFFELWRQEMLKDADHPKRKEKVQKKGEKKRKSPRQPHDHRQKFYERAVRTGEYIQQAPNDYAAASEASRQQMTNGRLIMHANQQPIGIIRPESLELHQQAQHVYDSSSGYGSMSSNVSQHPRAAALQQNDYQQRSILSNYGVLSRNQQQLQGGGYYAGDSNPLTNSSHSAASSTTLQQEGSDQVSPQSVSSTDSSGHSRGGSRPAQPPPAPPPPSGPVQSTRRAPPAPDAVNGDVRRQFSRMQIDSTSAAAEILRYGRTVSPGISQQQQQQQSSRTPHERSTSPDLPPPPPPLYGENYTSPSDGKEPSPPGGNGYSAPPPPPPPPPNTFNGFSPPNPADKYTVNNVVPSSGSFQSSNNEAKQQQQQPPPSSSVAKLIPVADHCMDARSDLLREIRERVQLKKVDRKEEKEREKNATQGHDVAAILRRRMEDVMGLGSESEESASDFDDDDWDD